MSIAQFSTMGNRNDRLALLLQKQNWRLTRVTDTDGFAGHHIEHWARDEDRLSAIRIRFKDGVDRFRTFSRDAPPFQSGRDYSINEACCLLDPTQPRALPRRPTPPPEPATRTWHKEGYPRITRPVATGRDRAALMLTILESMREHDRHDNPGPEWRRECIEDANVTLCRPPLPPRQLGRLYAAVFRVSPEYGEQLFAPPPDDDTARLAPVGLNDLMAANPELPPAVITPLLRVGETMNIIAPPKVGKSWLVLDLALAVAAGENWLDTFPTTQGNVLIVDNELHGAVLANRAPRVADARCVPQDVYANIDIRSLRGQLVDIDGLGKMFRTTEPGKYKLVVLDALYRFLPSGVSENDNAALAAVYNAIDRYADMLQAAFVLIHHTSKGIQGGKSVTDTGAGAGAISRAADTHLVLRAHEEPECYALECEARSWPKTPAMVLRRDFPVWNVAPELDPAALKVEYRRRTSRAEKQPAPQVTPEEFVERFVEAEPRIREAILDAAVADGLSRNRAVTLMRMAASAGLIHRWSGRDGGWAKERPIS